MPENNDMTNRNNNPNGGPSDEDILKVFESIASGLSNLGSYTSEVKKLTEELKKVKASPSTNDDDKKFRNEQIKLIRDIEKFLRAKDKGTDTQTPYSYRRYFDDFSHDIDTTGKSLDEFKKYIKKLSDETNRTISDIRFQQAHLTSATRNVESESMDIQVAILEQYQQRLKDIADKVAENEAKKEDMSKDLAKASEDSAKQIEENNKKVADAEKKRLDALKKWVSLYAPRKEDQDQDAIKAAREELNKYTEDVKRLKQKTKENNEAISRGIKEFQQSISDAQRDQEAEVRRMKEEADKQRKEETENLEQRLGPVLKLVEESTGLFNSAASQSSILSDWIKDNEASEAERFNSMINKTKDALTRTIDELTKKIEEDRERLATETNLTQAQKDNIKKEMENLEKEREVVNKQREAVSKVTVVTDTMHKVSNDMKDVPWKTFKNVIGNLTRTIEAKYLDSYIEGFDKVYNSVESTRNTVSARMKLDQGGFEDLQNEIFEQIEQEGLTGAISLADVNEAIATMSSAGITDEEVLKQFAIEQAKLVASGSSITLSNEEMMTRLMSQIHESVRSGMSKDDAIQATLSQIDTVAQTEAAYREMTGDDMAFVHAGLDQIINSVLDLDTAFGKSQEETTKDLQDAVVTAGTLQGVGVDTNILMSQLKALAEGRITEQSAFGKALMQNAGITKDALKSGEIGMGEALSKIADNMEGILGDIAKDNANYLSDVSSIFGIEGTQEDIQRLLRALEDGAVQTTLSPELQKYIDSVSAQDKQALSEGTYLSATEKWIKSQENRATEEAIAMEKLYKGNEIFHDTVGGIFEGVKEIVNILEQGAFSVGDAFRTSGFAIFGSGGTTPPTSGTGGTGTTPPTGDAGTSGFASTARSFMTGDLSTTAGKVGTGLGVGVGAGISIYSVAKNISEYEGAEVWEKTFTDPTFYTGVGTALGSAIAGPIGGAIGGAFGKLSSEVGNKIGDLIAHSGAEDELIESANELKLSAQALGDSAYDQYTTAKAEYDKLSKYTKDEKKLALIQQGIVDLDKANKLSEEELQDLFEKNLLQQQENIMAESAQTLTSATYVTENSQNIANMLDMFTGMEDSLEYEKSFYDTTTKQGKEAWEKERESYISEDVKKFEGALGGPQAMKEIYSLFDVDEKTSDDALKLQLKGLGVDTETLEKSSRSELEEKYKELSIENFKQTSGMSEYTSELLDESIRKYEQRKANYEEANEKFQTHWAEAVEEAGEGAELATIQLAYGKHSETPGVTPKVLFDEDGKAYLDPESVNYKDSYVGKFESGFTDVPYDDYPALLHEGERVLTKEESKVYNKLSSRSIDQISKVDMSNLVRYIKGLESSISDISDSVETTNPQSIDIQSLVGNLNFSVSSPNDETFAENNVDIILAINEVSTKLDDAFDAQSIIDAIHSIDIDSLKDHPTDIVEQDNKHDFEKIPPIEIVDQRDTYDYEKNTPIEVINNEYVDFDYSKIKPFEIVEASQDSENNEEINIGNIESIISPESLRLMTDSLSEKLLDQISVINEMSTDKTINSINDYLIEQSLATENNGFSSYMNVEDSRYEQPTIDAKSLGTDEINTSIKTQTSTLEQKLDTIIAAISALTMAMRARPRTASDNTNVLRMNSNVTQISTTN